MIFTILVLRLLNFYNGLHRRFFFYFTIFHENFIQLQRYLINKALQTYKLEQLIHNRYKLFVNFGGGSFRFKSSPVIV